MTVMQLTGLKVTHYALPADDSPWKIKTLPPTSHLSHDGAENVVEAGIKFVFEDLDARYDFKNEKIPFERVMTPLETVIQSQLTAQASETSPNPQPYTNETMFDHVERWVEYALPDLDDDTDHEYAPIENRQELIVLVLTTIEYVFNCATEGVQNRDGRSNSIPLEGYNPLPDKHDYITSD